MTEVHESISLLTFTVVIVYVRAFTPEKALLGTKCDLVSLSLVSYNESGWRMFVTRLQISCVGGENGQFANVRVLASVYM